ncbi:hypothetical protein PIB30_099655, partial [Stylosanthes scabra]|nr:hypothetical protein [Stylosanthes scabra]
MAGTHGGGRNGGRQRVKQAPARQGARRPQLEGSEEAQGHNDAGTRGCNSTADPIPLCLLSLSSPAGFRNYKAAAMNDGSRGAPSNRASLFLRTHPFSLFQLPPPLPLFSLTMATAAFPCRR